MEMTLKHRSLAVLLDPEKADLSRLAFTDECHPDYLFVGGSTGGDTTEFVQELKSKIKNTKYPSFFFPEIRPNLPRKQTAFYSFLYSLVATLNFLWISKLSLHGAYIRRLWISSQRRTS